jgi:glyoxylase-like metal-dependent hydrolase (beta-lactamase superfamily II)
MTQPASIPVTEVAPGLHRFELGPDGFVNAYLIETDGQLTLFDSGFPGDGATIKASIESLGLDAANLTHIVLSHAHMDHSGSAGELRELTGAQVLATKLDGDLLASGFSGRGLKIRPGYEDVFWARIEAFAGPDARNTMDFDAPPPCEPLQVDGFLEPGSELPGVPGSLIIATPGHSAGHVSVLLPDGVLLAGDAAEHFEAVTAPIPAEDHEVAAASFAQLGDLDYTTAVFGHGEPVTSDAAALLRQQRGA